MNNIVEFLIPEIENINLPAKGLESKTLQKLIMYIRADINEKVFITVKSLSKVNMYYRQREYVRKRLVYMYHIY